ncbi:MAG TPA: PDDEXK nuclease domain-containing protein [Chitinophagales bacterium]|nr:PDDEXK nuclease domain-containing protein [Chitinophagales bacterium]
MELDNNYAEILQQAVAEIKQARLSIAKQINMAAHGVYWNLGKILSEKKIEKGHGAGVVNRLSVDLKAEFPNMGLSPRNLWDMKRFYEYYVHAPLKLRQAVAVLPWKHNLLILSKVKNHHEAQFYAEKAIALGWSRDILLNYLKADAYQNEKSLPKTHNFKETLPEIVAEQADEMLKSSYNLGFLGLTQAVRETELEQRLIEKIKQFVLELGKGFTFIGNQYRLEYNQKEYFIDILLYHRALRCLVALELKIGSFKPEYVGKMNFYLGLLDRLEKQADENPSIGIILCADKDHLDVEIALQDINKPIGIAEYKLLLPTKELEAMIINELNHFNQEKENENE